MAIKKLAPAKPGMPQSIQSLKDENCMVVGSTATGVVAGPKTSGIKIRGTGCATKGVTARGPMA